MFGIGFLGKGDSGVFDFSCMSLFSVPGLTS